MWASKHQWHRNDFSTQLELELLEELMLFQIFKYFFPLKERTILETILEIFLKK